MVNMKNRRLLTGSLAFALALFTLFAGVQAGGLYSPMPINIHADITDANGIEIKITNLRTGISDIATLNSAGEAVLDWSNTDDKGGTLTKWVVGDPFEAVIVNCQDNLACKEEFVLKQPEALVEFDLSGVDLPCPTCETCETCPHDYTPYTYDDCEELVECPEPDPLGFTWESFGAGALLALIVALVGFMGGGLKIYKSRLGTVKMLHRHKGIREYHDPDTQHRNPAYRHRAWSEDPLGCAKDVKKIESEGGLV